MSEVEAVQYTALMEDPPEYPLEPGDPVELEPCIGEDELDLWEREHDQPCPRVLLEPGNREAANLAALELQSRASLSAAYGMALVFEHGGEYVAQSAMRAMNALGDDEVGELVRAAREADAPQDTARSSSSGPRAPRPFGKGRRRRRG